MAAEHDPLVVFSPSGKRGRFPLGTPILQAARSLGVDIDSVCGGRAMCGRCQVTVAEGELSNHGIVSRTSNLSPTGEAESKHRERRGLAADRRLSCQATVQGDVAIDVPESSQVHRQVVRKPYEAHDIEIDPVTHVYFVEVDKPDMHDPTGDLERLRAAIARDWQIENVAIALPALNALQSALRKGDWRVTVAIRDDREIIAVWPEFRERVYGVAIDVGSTTVSYTHLRAHET